MPEGDTVFLGVVALGARWLQANRSRGNQVTTGDPRAGRHRWVYGRRAEPCRRCGTAVVREASGEPFFDRVTYCCPVCQADSDDLSAESG